VPELRFQVLWHAFVVSVPDDAVADALAYVTQAAEQDLAVVASVRFDVVSVPDGYRVSEAGRPVVTVPDPPGVVDVLYQRVHTHALEHASHDGWVRAHAAVVDAAPGRVLLAGDSGVGKTTLALRLLFDGVAVPGDESVVLRDGVAVPVARPFHLKAGVEQFVPELLQFPHLPEFVGDVTVRAFDPTAAGFRWSITPAPVRAVVVVQRGSDSSIVRVESTQVMHEVVENVFWLHESKATLIREVASVFRTASCFRLAVADVTAAADAVRELELG
jgi:hypothetical protein